MTKKEFTTHIMMRPVESSNTEILGASEVSQSRDKLIFLRSPAMYSVFGQKLISLVKIRVDWNTIGTLSTSDN